MQFNFEIVHSKIRHFNIKLLNVKFKNVETFTYRRTYKYSKIKHCNYAHKNILRTCSTYNNVKLENFHNFQKKINRIYYIESNRDDLKQQIEK